MSIVNDAIQDGVSESGVAYDVVPMFDRNLTGDDGRGSTMAIVKDLQKVAPFGRIEHRQAPIIENEELNASEGFEQAAIAAVAPSEGECLEQTRDALILDRTIVAAGFVTEGASNPTFAEPGCSCNEQVLIAVDPVADDESSEDSAVDAAWRAQIDVFHACGLAQRSELEARCETLGVSFGGFAIDQKSDAFFERQGIEIW